MNPSDMSNEQLMDLFFESLTDGSDPPMEIIAETLRAHPSAS